jgi:hypothetical protein
MPRSMTRYARPVTSGHHLVAGTALVGAAAIVAGVVLPWFSLFAGLRPMTPVGSLNGALLLAGASVVAGLGIVTLLRGPGWARRGLSVMGIGLVAFSGYLLVNVVEVYRQVSADPLMVAQPGPGLALVAIGAVLILTTGLLRD